MTKAKGNRQGRPSNEVRELRSQIAELKRELKQHESNRAADMLTCPQAGLILRLPIDPLPADYKGYVFPRVDTTLHGEQRRTFTAVYHWLRSTHAVVPAHGYGADMVHVDSAAQAFQWLMTRIKLAGASGAAEPKYDPHVGQHEAPEQIQPDELVPAAGE